MAKPKIFITDGRSRATLVMSKFLHKRGIEVVVGESRWQCISFFSKFVSKRVIYPSAEKNPDDFLRFLKIHLKKYRYDAVFPVRDACTSIISKNKDEISKFTNLHVPDYDILKRANNKIELTKSALENNIPCPKTYMSLSSAIVDSMEFPILLRPKFGSGSRGIHFIMGKDNLFELIDEYGKEKLLENYLIQKYLPHDTKDQYIAPAIFDMDSNPIASLVLRKIREFPNSGGPMTAAISLKNERLTKHNNKLLKAIGWQGMCSVEYIYDRSENKFKLTEINARYYGALGTALYSGVDFPYYMYKLAIGDKVEPKKDYNSGIKWRWLYPGDLLSFLTHSKKSKEILDFIKFWEYKYAIFSLKNPLTTIGQTIDVIYRLLDKKEKNRVFNRGWTLKQ